MSYILDALKKSERERSHPRVPTIMTEQPWTPRRQPHAWIWAAVAGAVVAAGGLAVWLWPSPPQGVPQAALEARALRKPSPRERESGPMAARPEAAQPPAIGRRDPVGPEVPPAREALRPVGPGRVGPPGMTMPAPRRPSGRLEQPPAEPAPTQPVAIEPEPRSVPVGPAPALGAPSGPAGDPVRPDAVPPPPPPAPPEMPTLEQAIAKMRLDVFVYSAAEADRMVVINGRRYREGELVEGQYRLESILPEGAVLGHQGERALLKP